MNKEAVKSALSYIWVAVYRASQIDAWEFHERHEKPLLDALQTLITQWPKDDQSRGRLEFLCDEVRMCGVLSVPFRKPSDVEQIIADAKELERRLESMP